MVLNISDKYLLQMTFKEKRVSGIMSTVSVSQQPPGELINKEEGG